MDGNGLTSEATVLLSFGFRFLVGAIDRSSAKPQRHNGSIRRQAALIYSTEQQPPRPVYSPCCKGGSHHRLNVVYDRA